MASSPPGGALRERDDEPTSARPRLVGVGVGPGEPELVTLKAVRELAAADVVFVPSTERSGSGAGRAEVIVRAVCPDQTAIRRLPFSMADRRGVTPARRSAWEASAQAVVDAFDAGARAVALATVGDPSVYSTFSYLAGQVHAVRPDVTVDVVPGITAMQALAAASKVPLVEGTEVLALVPVTAGLDVLDAAFDVADTVVAYKAGRQITDVLRRAGRTPGRTIVGTDVSLPTERITTGEGYDGDRAPYFSTVIRAPERPGVGGRL